MFKFDKKVSDTIKMADKSKEKISRAEQIMRGIKIPETFENRGKITENIELLNTASKGIKVANRTLDKKINEIVAIGKKNSQLQNVSSLGKNNLTSNFNLTSNNELNNSNTLNPDYLEYKKAFDFADEYIDWDKYNEEKPKSDEVDIIKILLELLKIVFESEWEKKKRIANVLYEEYGIVIYPQYIEEIKNDKGTMTIVLQDGTEIIIYGHESEAFQHGLKVRITNDDQELLLMKNGYVTYRDSQSDVSLSKVLEELNPEDIVPVYTISEEEQEKLRREFSLEEGIPISGYSVININGQDIKVYWIGDDVYFKDFQKNIKIIEEQISNYPPNALDKVFNSGDFKGVLVGTKRSPTYKDEYAAFAHLDEYIYMDVDSYDFNKKSTVYHEFAHILDSTLYGGNGHYTEHEQEILDLYDEYKMSLQEIPELSCNGYCNRNQYPDGVPNVKEFFATIVELYFSRPEELEALLPELYDYVDNIFKSI